MRMLIASLPVLFLAGPLGAEIIGRITPVRTGPSLPAHCTPAAGGLYFRTSTPGLFYCASRDVWAPMSAAGGGSLPDSPTLTGHPTIEGVTSTGATGSGKIVFSTAPVLGDVSASSYATTGSGAGVVTWKNSGDSNYVAFQGYSGTRAASLTLVQPGTNPTATAGVPSWNAPSSGVSTFSTWINPTRLESYSVSTVSPTPAATVCLASVPFSAATPLNTAGSLFSYFGNGSYTSGTSALVTFKLQLSTAANCGGTTIDLASNTYGTALAASGSWRVAGTLAVLTTGATGTVTSFIEPSIMLTGSAYQIHPTTLGSTTVDTTRAAYYLNLVASTTVANPQWTQNIAMLQRVN